jgi:alpha-tubulin suppressor-like RCC1 family protein
MSKRYNGGFLSAVWTPLATHGDSNYLYLWSYNNNGRLGDNTALPRSSPVQIGTTTWSNIAAARFHSIALKTDGTMWAWGYNDAGQVGDNTVIHRSSPVQVGSLTTWSQIAGGSHSLAIKTDGTLWGWGDNAYGDIGDNTSIHRSSPVQIGALTNWSKVAAGRFHSIALKTDGTLWTWGDSTYGALGGGGASTAYKSSPTQVGALTTWSSIADGQHHTIAIKTDGTLWTWGRNSFGQLGDNTGGAAITKFTPGQVGALTTWSQIAGGQSQTYAIKTDGTLWSWGDNGSYQLGDGTQTQRSSPVQVGALTNWSKIASSSNTVLAIKTDGTMWAWGSGANGDYGDNTTTPKSSPIQVGSLTWSLVAGGDDHCMALSAVPF